MKRLAFAALLLWPALAQAHGGLPVSAAVLRENGADTMYIPVAFWGLWIGDGVAPWRWICEEEINLNRARKFALSAGGTFYTNDTRGLTISNDHGCTWLPATGEISQLRITSVAAHHPATAPPPGSYQRRRGRHWPTAASSPTTRCSSRTITAPLFRGCPRCLGAKRPPLRERAGRAQRRKHSVRHLGRADGAVHGGGACHSIDGGMTFEADAPLNFTVDGAPAYSFEVMAIDPRDPDVLYLRAFVTVPGDGGDSTPLQVLLRSYDHGLSVAEMTRVVGEMTPFGRDPAASTAWRWTPGAASLCRHLARAFGRRRSRRHPGSGGTLAPTSSLTQAQCVDVHGAAVYACSSNYSPDFAALGAVPTTAPRPFHSVLSYQATEGPIDCPPGTPVGDNCPAYWLMYSAQLGINMGLPDGEAPPIWPAAAALVAAVATAP